MRAVPAARWSRILPALAALALASAGPAAAEPVVGRASVIDGDTLDIRGQRFRLHGVDTPESGQTCRDAEGAEYRCGQRAALALADRIGSGPVACEPIEEDRYGRTVAVCRSGSEDLNAWLVREGLGLAYRQYSTAYVAREDEARTAKRGLWSGTFTPPWEWRKERRTGPASDAGAPAAVGACAIKGNISRAGERIYHVPGSRDYARTVIREVDGERMFCTAAEAEAAGWRAPLR